MDACHGRGTLPSSQHPNMLVRTWRTRRGTEQFFRCSWHGKMKPYWLHCEASSPVKDLPIKHRNPPAWHGGWGAGYIAEDCWKRRKSLLSSSGTKGRSCEDTLLSQAWQVRTFSLYCHLGAKISPASLPSHFNPCIEGTLAFHFQPAGVQLSSRSTAPAASRLYPKGCCSKPQWGDRHRCHPTCSNAQPLFSLHLYEFWKGLNQNHPGSAECLLQVDCFGVIPSRSFRYWTEQRAWLWSRCQCIMKKHVSPFLGHINSILTRSPYL